MTYKCGGYFKDPNIDEHNKERNEDIKIIIIHES
jgi:hypothetical protein